MESPSNDEAISIQEIRRVITHVMSYSASEMNRFKDSIEERKDEDPARIAQLHIKLVEHSAEWNTAFLIARELKIKLDPESVDPPRSKTSQAERDSRESQAKRSRKRRTVSDL